MSVIPLDLEIPTLYSQEDADDPIVHLKLFTPFSSWTWLVTEYDPARKLGFGFAYDAAYPEGAELGYLSVAQLEGLRTRWGTPAVERDIHFTPKPLSEAKRLECP